jgi:hypothetical protein
MRKTHLITLLAIVATALVGCGHTPAKQMSAAEPVISVEESSRMFRVVFPHSGKDIIRGVHIFEDGRCMVYTDGGEELERKLRPSDVRGLLDYFDHQGLFSISNASIERAIGRDLLKPVRMELPDGGFSDMTRGRICVVDGSDTRISVCTRTEKVEICRHALREELQEYRIVTELRTVKRCIERVYEVAGKIE